MNKIRGFKIKLRKREILKTLKYNPAYSGIEENLENRIQNQIENAYELIFPSVIYETYSMASESYEQLLDVILMGSDKVKELLDKAVAFTLMAVTVGSALEKEVDRIKGNDLSGAYILDAAGSEAVEQSANFLSRVIKEEASKQECYLGVRFSPGYSDWPVEASRVVIDYLGAERIDLVLTPDGILNPRKSITALQTWIKQ
jgi:hypothetical protein